MVSFSYARERHDAVLTSIKEGRYDREYGTKKSKTWKDLRYAFMRKLEIEGKSKVYQKDSSRFLLSMAAAWGDDKPIADVTPAMIRQFRLTLLERGVKEATCDRYLSAGKAAWNHFEDDMRNPFSRVRFFCPDNSVTRFLTSQQRVDLLDAARSVSQVLYEVLVVALGTGLRKSNILELKREEVDFDAMTITVTQKGGRKISIPMVEAVAAVLKGVEESDVNYFWVSPRTGRPFHKDWRKSWKKAKTLAGIPDDFRFHDLRHDVGTAIYQATGDTRIAQKMLGHTQLSTTLRYAHVSNPGLRDAAERALVNLDTRSPENVPPIGPKDGKE